ncbi:NAD(P)/FAD-dependent oxidoreductase [Labedaea rhizosphaerae]|uniref:Sulfide:quinone oxidoreductase n=1 Tax=Labedaea rhizosphaerae TaxID=598644 RepID=A0A4R6SFQ0_LABRH|nr:FAD/NAD(P)-binding oxidoreductase [Labedaea rhizosphaerae]TDQ00327.1 sulfide:quinone oxidoreductase [Labedaea rhizosphaerae]
MSRTVAILGAGVGGLTTASRLRELLPPEDRIVLVDRTTESVQGLSLLWVMRGWRAPAQVTHRPGRVQDLGIEVLEAEVEALDVDRRIVVTSDGDIVYDALVVALGAVLRPDKLPGLTQAIADGEAGQFYTLEGAIAVGERLRSLRRGRLVVAVAAMPFKCPAAPYEGALLAADLLGERGVRPDVRIDMYTPEPFPMPVAGAAVGERLSALLAQRDIGFHPTTQIERVEPGGVLRFADGSRVDTEYLIAIPPHGAPDPVVAAGFSDPGWIPVDPRTLRAEPEAVWAMGDVALVTLANGKPLPKAAVFARGQAEAVATGVARHLGVDVAAVDFDGAGYCYVEAGGGLAAKGAGNFYASPAPAVTLTDLSEAAHHEKESEERDWIRDWSRESSNDAARI